MRLDSDMRDLLKQHEHSLLQAKVQQRLTCLSSGTLQLIPVFPSFPCRAGLVTNTRRASLEADPADLVYLDR